MIKSTLNSKNKQKHAHFSATCNKYFHCFLRHSDKIARNFPKWQADLRQVNYRFWRSCQYNDQEYDFDESTYVAFDTSSSVKLATWFRMWLYFALKRYSLLRDESDAVGSNDLLNRKDGNLIRQGKNLFSFLRSLSPASSLTGDRKLGDRKDTFVFKINIVARHPW